MGTKTPNPAVDTFKPVNPTGATNPMGVFGGPKGPMQQQPQQPMQQPMQPLQTNPMAAPANAPQQMQLGNLPNGFAQGLGQVLMSPQFNDPNYTRVQPLDGQFVHNGLDAQALAGFPQRQQQPQTQPQGWPFRHRWNGF